MALAALDHPVDKIRINPGNIGGIRPLPPGASARPRTRACPMRIGVNAGSLEREFAEKYGFPCPPAMVESALRYIEIAESRRLSRHHRVAEVERRAHRRRGVSAVRQAGELPDAHRHHRGGQGALRGHQVGVRPGADPARRHRRHDPHQPAGRPGAGDRGGVRHPAGDAAARAQAGADRLPDVRPAGDRPGRRSSPSWRSGWRARTTPVKISVLGCVVNGPGEAREADLGIAAGKGKGMIFKRGEIVRHVLENEMVDALMEEITCGRRKRRPRARSSTGAVDSSRRDGRGPPRRLRRGRGRGTHQVADAEVTKRPSCHPKRIPGPV